MNVCHIAHTMYYVWAKYWADIVGKESLLVVNSDLYYNDRMSVMEKVFTFLDMPQVSVKTADEIQNRKPGNANTSGKKIPLGGHSG